jgi:hypothetical protein
MVKEGEIEEDCTGKNFGTTKSKVKVKSGKIFYG